MPRTTAPPQHPRAAMIAELRQLQEHLTEEWLDKSLPEEWEGLDSTAPVMRPKTRVTIRLDADMVKWFRRLGPGYGARINQILRLYWLALIEGRVVSHWDEEAAGPQFGAYLERQMDILKEQRDRRRAAPDDRSAKELADLDWSGVEFGPDAE